MTPEDGSEMHSGKCSCCAHPSYLPDQAGRCFAFVSLLNLNLFLLLLYLGPSGRQ